MESGGVLAVVRKRATWDVHHPTNENRPLPGEIVIW
jgi:hypothetical protein